MFHTGRKRSPLWPPFDIDPQEDAAGGMLGAEKKHAQSARGTKRHSSGIRLLKVLSRRKAQQRPVA
eukprot:1153873-Pelagomonas_calceolata.AAC.1